MVNILISLQIANSLLGAESSLGSDVGGLTGNGKKFPKSGSNQCHSGWRLVLGGGSTSTYQSTDFNFFTDFLVPLDHVRTVPFPQ